MGKINLMIAIILLSGIYVQISAQLNEPTEKFSIVEVQVPNKKVYDDGIYRKLYSSFQVFNEDGRKVIGVPEKYDRPDKIKLKEGNYKFVVRLENGDLLERDFTVEGNQFQVISVK